MLTNLLADVRNCRVCEEHLPSRPRPIVQLGERARIVIVGQAPGAKVHDSGVPWRDASGDHLREWLSVDADVFYDPNVIALIPMGFCYPGKRAGGDAPPRPECAPLWHEPLLQMLPEGRLIVLAGQYAHRYYLGKARKKSLTATVQTFEDYLPKFFPLPHPSWRSKIWMKKNPWFARTVLPALRAQISARM